LDAGAGTSYIYSGTRLIAPVGGDGVGSPQTHFVISDHLGYPEMVTDTTGAPLWTPDHFPFGETVSETGEVNDPLLRYPGQWAVPRAEELNLPTLFYNGYRWYRPQWGRYTQADPIGLRGGMNLFGYAKGNPLRFVDPLGMTPKPTPTPIPRPQCDGWWWLANWVRTISLSNLSGLFSCECYWICRSCPGKGFDMRSTREVHRWDIPENQLTTGKVINTGKDPESGDGCSCAKPGPEKGCCDKNE